MEDFGVEVVIRQVKPNNYAAKKDSLGLLTGTKKTLKEADYRMAGADSKVRCHECKFYLKPGQPESDCAKVISVVRAEGVCDLFSQKQYTKESNA